MSLEERGENAARETGGPQAAKSCFREALERIERDAELIADPSFGELRELSKGEGTATANGSVVYFTKVKGRSSRVTEVIEPGGKPTRAQEDIVRSVADYLKGKKLVRMDRRMGMTKTFLCRAYVSAAYAHIAYMWARMLFEPKGKWTSGRQPDFTSVQVPEWPETKIIADPNTKTTFILGSDYTGEMKKANLRMAMYSMKQDGGLGLHAGSKVLRVRDGGGTGELVEKGVLLFGLSATGKTTLTCHHHWLDAKKGEGVGIRQDDVVLMAPDSHCAGTEDNFYIKTDGLEPEDQPLLYGAALSKNALFENVKVLQDGRMDFFDSSITSNGRGVVLRKEIGFTGDSIDLPRADMVLFITRRNTIVPPVAKLEREQAAAFFMLGESIGSSAADVDQGKDRREVGTNPFIIGPKDEEGNRFYDLLGKNPHVECYLLNTGKVGLGGDMDGKGEKITVHDSATIIKEIARGSPGWRKDPDWGYEILDECEGVYVSKFHPERHYTKERYAELTGQLRKERKEWLAQFPKLYPKIRDAV